MPNHVTNVITASKEVISSMLNADRQVDFCIIIPRHEDLSLDGSDGISCSAEWMAQHVCEGKPLFSTITAMDMADDELNQFFMMVKSKRKHGFYHMMDYAISAWGTKWNAYDCDIKETEARFDTAWSHPDPVIQALSKKFPSEVISVEYADEDTGSNCGFYSIKNGCIVRQFIAPSWNDQTDAEKSKWSEFSIKLRYGQDSKPEDFDRDENWNYIEE